METLLPTATPSRRAALFSPSPRVVLAHHWMEFFRGGEAVLEQFCILFPQAPISMLVCNRRSLTATMRSHVVQSSVLQRWPFVRQHFRKLLPFFPRIVRGLRLPADAQLVLTSDASLMKGVQVPDQAMHICYCHSPPRYLWGMQEAYMQSSSHASRVGRMMFSAASGALRAFDEKAAQRVDCFIANSRFVQRRIRHYYGRESVIIHPPVNVDNFDPTRPRDDFYLVVSALVPYKRVDLIVDACSRLGRPLVVLGTGSEEADLRRRAGPTVQFLGWQTDMVVKDHFERCRAFLFPGIEDFGITPCEAQAAGAPVIAYRAGGAMETVREGVSGQFFESQTVDAVVEAIEAFESAPPLSSEDCRANVEHLAPERFRAQIWSYLCAEFPELLDSKQAASPGQTLGLKRHAV